MDDRTLLAGLAMAGIFASGHKDTLETVTDDAVIAADMLLKALSDSRRSLSPKRPTGSVKGFKHDFSWPESSIKAARANSGY